jgi:hypothetical protein
MKERGKTCEKVKSADQAALVGQGQMAIAYTCNNNPRCSAKGGSRSERGSLKEPGEKHVQNGYA